MRAGGTGLMQPPENVGVTNARRLCHDFITFQQDAKEEDQVTPGCVSAAISVFAAKTHGYFCT